MQSQGFIYTIVDNYPTNFKVRLLKLYMYKLVDGKYELRDEAAYNINGDYYFTYFQYTMKESGKYKAVVYDGGGRYVNTGYVTITW